MSRLVSLDVYLKTPDCSACKREGETIFEPLSEGLTLLLSDHDSLVQAYLEACREHPNAEVSVSR